MPENGEARENKIKKESRIELAKERELEAELVKTLRRIAGAAGLVIFFWLAAPEIFRSLWVARLAKGINLRAGDVVLRSRRIVREGGQLAVEPDSADIGSVLIARAV